MVGVRYSTLPQKKGSQRLARLPKQAFFSSESGGRSGARREKGAPRVLAAAGTATRVNVGAAEEAAAARVVPTVVATAEVADRHPGRCWQCNRRGHIKKECTAKESDFIAKCAGY